MTKPETRYDRKKTHFRSVGVILVVTVILIGAIVWIGTGPASTSTRSSIDPFQRGIGVAKPESMKQFPDDLIPMP
jgi:hypothetical protein